jgi:Uma2 family endonuclease
MLTPAQIAQQFSADRALWTPSVQQFLDMMQMGIISEDDRVELIEGVIVARMPGNPPHASAQNLFLYWLMGVLDSARWIVSPEQPIVLAHSVPVPDLCVLRGHLRTFSSRHPQPDDVALVIEIADTTLHSDRTVKRALYAGAGIAQLWIVNLIDRQIEVYSDPDRAARAYRHETIYPADGMLTLTLDGAAVASCPAADLLP